MGSCWVCFKKGIGGVRMRKSKGLEDLINFYKTEPLDKVTQKLIDIGIEFYSASDCDCIKQKDKIYNIVENIAKQ